MHRPRALVSALVLLASTSPAVAAADGGGGEQKPLPVLNKPEFTFRVRDDDPDIQSREVWYRRKDGNAWGAWQKHGQVFPRNGSIVWKAPEGHLQVYFRLTNIANVAMPEPGDGTVPNSEFIVDRTAPTGQFAFPVQNAKLRGAIAYTVRFVASDANLGPAPIGFEWSRSGDGKFEPIADGLPNGGGWQWTVPRDMTKTGVLRMKMVDKAGNVGTADIGPLIVDSVAPSGRVTGPQISPNAQVALTAQAQDAGPAGLSSVQLWISRDDGKTWGEGPLVADGPLIASGSGSIAWQAPSDGRYRLALVCIDQAGNPSLTPKGPGEDQATLIVDSQKPVVTLATATGIAEAAGGGPNARNAFKAGDRVAVNFAIQDANLAQNPVTVLFSRDDGKTWQELAKAQPADTAYRFEIPAGPDTNAARIAVRAIDIAGNVGDVVAQQSFMIKSQIQGPGVIAPE